MLFRWASYILLIERGNYVMGMLLSIFFLAVPLS